MIVKRLVSALDGVIRKEKKMKKIILLITVLTNIAYSWEVNTHRAIDKTAIGKATILRVRR